MRLAAWHDAMVAHDRKIGAGRAEEVCDEECPYAEARRLWAEALEVFGDRAQELTFLRSRAALDSKPSDERVASASAMSEAADRVRHSTGAGHNATAWRSKGFAGSSERSRTATAEL
jgi:hypothetical protein